MNGLVIRPAGPSDRPALRTAVVELHEQERRLHDSRRPGEETADDYLVWMLASAARDGAVLVAEVNDAFAVFAAGWIVQEEMIEETAHSSRFGYVSDICVMPPFRGRRIASLLLDALEMGLARTGVARIRLGALAANAPGRRAYERAGYLLYEVVYEKQVGRR